MHVIDHVPTILEVTGIAAPEVVDGIQQKPIEGTSYAYTFDKENAKAPSRHTIQYFEMMGQWALYKDGWLLSTKVNRAPWDAFSRGQPGPAEQPGVPALRPEHQLEPGRGHRRAAPGQGQGNAGAVPGGGQEISGLAAGCVGRSPRGRSASQPHRRSQRVCLYAAHDRSAAGRCAVSARYVLQHQGGDHRSRGRCRGHDRDLGRALRRLRLLPAQGQAGIPAGTCSTSNA